MKTFTNVLRQEIIKMIHNAKSGHPGGAYSCVDILAVLYKKVLNVPVEWDKAIDFSLRDRFIKKVLEQVPFVKLNGPIDTSKRLPANADFSFEYIEGESILFSLDLNSRC